jgi:chromosome segregation ATPase
MTATDFLTPPRILIPKLLRSRDAWKAKATQRKAQRKALQIRVRDLTASRDRHRQRADHLQQQVDALQLRVDHLQQQVDVHQRQREQLPTPCGDTAQKK